MQSTTQPLALNIAKPRKILRELDIFRGIAVLFMIYNHATYEFLPSEFNKIGISGFLTLITSFAPVLFFFATGVGYGLQNNKTIKQGYWLNIFYKVMLLMVSYQFLYWREGKGVLGINFLGFIGISVLVLSIVRVSKSSWIWCISIIIGTFILRYILGGMLLDFLGDRNILAWISGAAKNTLFTSSYPLSPWITYPCLGYLLGAFIANKKDRTFHEFIYCKKNGFYLWLIACFFSFTSIILLIEQVNVFRWGTVSFGFYWISFWVLAVTLLGIYLGKNWLLNPLPYRYLGLQGVTSFASVPTHYLTIFAFTLILPEKLNRPVFWVLFLLIYGLSIVIAQRIDQSTYYVERLNLPPAKILLVGMGGLMITAFFCLVFLSLEWVVQLSSFVGQSIACILFILRW